jgi:hypothetical protein
LFWDFLMHGYMGHHFEENKLAMTQLTPNQKTHLVQLLDRYFEAGLPDPGIDTFVVSEVDKQRLAAKYPQMLDYWRRPTADESVAED